MDAANRSSKSRVPGHTQKLANVIQSLRPRARLTLHGAIDTGELDPSGRMLKMLLQSSKLFSIEGLGEIWARHVINDQRRLQVLPLVQERQQSV